MHLPRNIYGVYHPGHKVTLFMSHLFLLCASFYAASVKRLGVAPEFLSIEFTAMATIIMVSMFFGGVFTSVHISPRPKLPLKTFFIVLSSALPSLVFVYLMGPERFTALLGRGVYPIALLAFAILAVSNQYLWNRIFYHPSTEKWTVVIGSGSDKNKIQTLLSTRGHNLKVKGFVDIKSLNISSDDISSIVLSPKYLACAEEKRILMLMRLKGVPIFSLSDFLESFFFLIPVSDIDSEWFIRSGGFSMLESDSSLRFKRFIDVVAATAILFIASPVILVTCLLIPISSKGTVFFKQTRVGLNGEFFTLIKFRTMHMNAEDDGAKWAQENDSRIYAFGSFLRRTRIDELPQCWNILRGEMSLVGPRPERPVFTQELSKEIPYYDLRHVVKPGLTGWAQVSYPYGSSVEDALKKLQFDLYYIKNYSLVLDLNIMLRTALVMLRRSGR